MRSMNWTGLLAIVVPVVSTAAAAQTPSAAQAGGASATPPRVTVTGCIERADQIVQRGNDPVDSLDFVLIKAQQKRAAESPVGTGGTAVAPGRSPHGPSVPGKPEVSGLGATYRLRARTAVLNPHVGHQVEISGAVMPSVAPGSTGLPAAPAGGAAGAPTPEQAPVLSVDAITLMSETCPR